MSEDLPISLINALKHVKPLKSLMANEATIITLNQQMPDYDLYDYIEIGDFLDTGTVIQYDKMPAMEFLQPKASSDILEDFIDSMKQQDRRDLLKNRYAIVPPDVHSLMKEKFKYQKRRDTLNLKQFTKKLTHNSI